MRRLMALLRSMTGQVAHERSTLTTPEVRRAVLRRLEEQKIILAGLDAQLDARRWPGAERRKTPR